jgi:hypothetical protein
MAGQEARGEMIKKKSKPLTVLQTDDKLAAFGRLLHLHYLQLKSITTTRPHIMAKEIKELRDL